MANNSAWTFFHFFSLIVTLFSYMACAGNISFSFPPPTDIKLGFDAYFHWDELQLTTADAMDDFAWSAGWAIYNKPVPLWDKSSGALASFTAHFQFAMENLSDISSFTVSKASDSSTGVGEDELLGGGGFGSVYRGTLPVTNEAVAVKRISQESKQGKKEYITEVIIISKLRHRNLVRLLGWCHEQGTTLLVA
ncbi:hypothetical protein SUGI_0561740 [Cryptomeria japonica]|nr:hypothetical protein SUGI_0561740 [Cryptomeria japonica]